MMKVSLTVDNAQETIGDLPKDILGIVKREVKKSPENDEEWQKFVILEIGSWIFRSQEQLNQYKKIKELKVVNYRRGVEFSENTFLLNPVNIV